MAFYECNRLENVTIPDSVKIIGDSAFRACSSLTGITIPSSVTSIGESAFDACSSLTGINVDINNQSYSSDMHGALYNKNKTELIKYPVGNPSNKFAVPNSVISIGDKAFYGCNNLTAVTIGNNVENIGIEAFYTCSELTSIAIPDSVTNIGESAFKYCPRLADITIGNGITSIGRFAFEDTHYYNDESNWKDGVLYISNCLIKASSENSLPSSGFTVSSEYAIKAGTIIVADYAFIGCSKLTSITIPNGLKSIGEKAFDECGGITNITIPDSVSRIGASAFRYCSKLKNITISSGLTAIGSDAFLFTEYYNNNSNWEDGVLYIGEYLITAVKWTLNGIFLEPSITVPSDYTIKTGTTLIADMAFVECEKLKSVTIPNSVKYIGEKVFYICNNFKEIYYNGAQAYWNSIEINANNKELTNATIHFKGTASVGDISGDSQINSTDALMVLQYSVGSLSLSDSLLPYADVNGDGKVNSSDALLVLQYSVGIINSFPKK